MPVFHFRQSWGNFEDLQREVDRLLGSIRFPFPVPRWERQYPPLNLYELDHEYLLVAEIPGATAENIELTVSGGVLQLKSGGQPPAGLAEDRFRRQERFRGAWERALTIPERVQEEQVSAEFGDGILTVHLPKIAAAAPRQIPVVGNHDHPAAPGTPAPLRVGANGANP